MNKLPPLEPGIHYHIYNRVNGSENLFRKEADYRRFLLLYDKYISPVADTMAWVLMPNHFHFLVKIREGMVYKYSKEDFIRATPSNTEKYAGMEASSPFSNTGAASSPLSNVGRSTNAGASGFEAVKWKAVHLPASERPGSVNKGIEFI